MSFPIRARTIALGAGAVIALTACASNPVHYYTLVSPAATTMATAAAATARAAAPLAINVLPIGIPAQLDQQQMVVRSGTGRAVILDNERWVAPLGDELRAALSSALVEQLGAHNVTGLPRPSNQTVMSIRTQVRRFDAWPGRMAQFEADWAVGVQQDTPGMPGTPGTRISCSTRLNEAIPGSYADMVRVQQRMIEQFAARVASTVRSVGSGRAACPADS
ncbi:TPA: membrane integrity-associated transporter subunit PqiC [Burkholderia aenigmatica]|uniref:PqiC family protein n=1 Tax=Burkholderia sp. AU45251 TaxID=3059204 RepID=UPI002656AF77|nr:PqiC family protein [Burkholderia sp. AU45251]HDR9482932.1 membrane integrity-associated transporter subunit PqiC [Burkholderia aenigmatica]MDN7515797.1 PqiC family protein [Burkholderia sp. AU45251]HDR9488467.1 membrane integrity-associated transporter subunit PqiC [Burkholderia aenigmatica]HDR9513879.1 membrane integrity-associated transporter subunit PqiC [Burkholderia aenigmatica]HDR9520647.1 membrane integrity-associated transporter subunit PqiC [Burkholderia aenigmatica]